MRRRVFAGIAALAGIAACAWLRAAQAEEVEHNAATASARSTMTALRPVFAPAGPPNFGLSIEAELDNGGAVKVERRLVKNVAAGTVRMPFSERKLLLSGSGHERCRVDGTLIAFFGGLQLSSESGAAECGGTSSDIEGRLLAVTDIKGELFPLQEGDELSYTAQAAGEMLDLFPSAVHRLRVAGMLSGVTLNATGAPDVIYLIRDDEGPDGAKMPIVTDIYWSAALRWPIQMRLRTDDGKLTLVEHNLLWVTGVMPYVLPDGRTISDFDERTSRSHPLAEIGDISRALWRAARSETTHDVHSAAAQVMGKLIDPEATPSGAIDPAFASIAAFVTIAPASQQEAAPRP
jgi:hypothetical protein